MAVSKKKVVKKSKGAIMEGKKTDMGFNMTPKFPTKHFASKKKIAKMKGK